jgi:glycosyltransferase involved in cell wall biosynthesis
MLSVCGNDKVVAIAAYSDTLTGIANSNLVQAAVRDIWDHLCALPSLNIPNRKLSESVSGSAYLELDIELLGSEIVAAYDHFASAENIADGGAVSSVLGQLWESRVRRAFEVTGKYRLTPPERPIRQRVNVLFIGLRGTRRSGGDRTLENIASGLDHSQFGLVLAVPDKVGSLADHWRAQNLNVMEFDYGRVGLHVQSEHLPAWQLADDDRVAESDLVFANNLYVNRIAATVARRLNVPLITRIISLTTHEELFANLAFEASLVVVPSAFMAKHCSDLGIPSSQIRIVHEAVAFGLDTSERKKGAFRSNLGISGDKQIIGVAARWDEQYKGLDTILLTAKLVTAARNDVHFAILGGTSRHSLPPHWARKLSSILSIEANVHFTGHLDSVEDAYREMSVLLHPAESEPFGLAVTEAMWFAIPVVASNTGGVPEQITNGVDGVLVDQRTPQNYASALLGLLGDPEARIRLGHAGQRRARQFYSLDRFSSEVSQLINDLVSQRA